MSKKLKKNVPALRFPEFEGDWKNDVIGNHVKEYKERVLSNTNLTIYTSSRELSRLGKEEVRSTVDNSLWKRSQRFRRW